ncbi:prolyl oligopeptidase family serine peptidase [Oleiagrimonas sp.]|jgi:dienelactone hydrolase|uniref:S9 family peptidase n=1 Tax=Oleiagrimonas sp. TaxID=2010330 RepID=UPI00261E59EA|nr:prolyl oligopeptidase family serine peptidase [Oleiagrimonas sp.]MDA3915220.1 prolyl oligopeptidase family serine peptidase [Oleiagrimonas sp.]
MSIRGQCTKILGASLLAFAQLAMAQASPGQAVVPLKDFAKHAHIGDPALSPDGKYLALRMDDADGIHHAVVTYQLSDMKIVGVLKMPIYQLPASITWVSPTRLVIEQAVVTGSLDIPRATGEILSADFNGKNQRYLYGYDAKGSRTQTRARDEGNGFVAGVPHPHDGHVYVDVQPWGMENITTIYNIDSVHNTRHLVGDIDQGGMNFLINKNGQTTYAFGDNTQNEFVAFRKIQGRWKSLPDSIVGSYFNPFMYSPDQKKIYAWSSDDNGPYQLIVAKPDASDPQTLMADPFSNFGHVQTSPWPYKIFAVSNVTGIPKPDYINPNLPSAKLYMALSKAFKGQFVDFINYSQDGMELLFETSSDRNPGTYYLINRHNNKVRKLFDTQPSIHPAQMSQRVPFRFKSSSGMELGGILTLPRGRARTHLPMVLVPHGGPYYVSDDWFFDSDAQMLASRGYLVLQVNFRGSSGRGPGFYQSGFKQWGTGMQQDLADGVKWAIAHHYADPDRICVYGGSFGGYSALMQVIRHPKLYKCAVSYDGVTDLNMDIKKSDTGQYASGLNYFHMVLGDTAAIRAANSPVNLVDKIHVPVFLIHGKDDKRVPYAEATEMRAALEKAGKPYEWMAKSGEGHGFYNTNNRLEMYTRLLAFLKKNIGPGAPVQASQ